MSSQTPTGRESPSASPAARTRIFSSPASSPATPSPVRREFHRLMKRLEKTLKEEEKETHRLDRAHRECVAEIYPLLAKIHRANFEMVRFVREALATGKYRLSARRHRALADLLSAQVTNLREDPVGLTDEEIRELEKIAAESGPSQVETLKKQSTAAELEALREYFEDAARRAGVDLDLSDLDAAGDPGEFCQNLQARLRAAGTAFVQPDFEPPRRPTRVQREKTCREREDEEAKTRDLKALYKRLAKALHPDREADPEKKRHKEEWMKRLTAAHAARDLREILRIETEWFGEEASHLKEADDGRLRIYCSLLKEQITEVKARMANILANPKYAILRRLRPDLSGRLPPVSLVRRDLMEKLQGLTALLAEVRHSDLRARAALNNWADYHARFLRELENSI
jgi:hypothetical protein